MKSTLPQQQLLQFPHKFLIINITLDNQDIQEEEAEEDIIHQTQEEGIHLQILKDHKKEEKRKSKSKFFRFFSPISRSRDVVTIVQA
jgi:hypothetical protein